MVSLSKEARELLERAIERSRTYARNNLGGDRDASEHIFGLCGLIEGVILAPAAAGASAQKPVATVRVKHSGYSMELSTHVAYALPEGLHDLYATPPADHWLRAWIDERRRLSLNPELHAHETANINLFLDELEKAWKAATAPT